MSSDSDFEDRKPAAKPHEKPAEDKGNKKRTLARNKKRSIKKKKELKHEKEWSEYCKFMNANLEKKTQLPRITSRCC